MFKVSLVLSLLIFLLPTAQADMQDDFWHKLVGLKGLSFAGKLTAGTEADDKKFMADGAVMYVWKVSENEIRIPFHIGNDHSRTWVLTRTAHGIQLKHDHRKEDGSDDEVTLYGGDTYQKGTPIRQEFKADKYTGKLLPSSALNIWAMEVELGKQFVYELRREHQDRFFRVEFDLSKPDKMPIPAWGDQ
jgi:hypothetical protein